MIKMRKSLRSTLKIAWLTLAWALVFPLLAQAVGHAAVGVGLAKQIFGFIKNFFGQFIIFYAVVNFTGNAADAGQPAVGVGQGNVIAGFFGVFGRQFKLRYAFGQQAF